MNITYKISAVVIGAIVAMFLFLTAMSNLQPVVASAPSGLYTTLSSSATTSVSGSTATQIVASSTNCASRAVTTITETRLTFVDAQTPSATYGHLQAASSTVLYDGGQYGCGTIKAFTYLATTSSETLFVSEFK